MEKGKKSKLRKLQGRYSYIHLYSQRTNVDPLTAEQKKNTPDVSHPFARIHPETGREGLYIGGDDFIAAEGSDEPQKDFNDIWQLFDEMTSQFFYHHRPDSVARNVRAVTQWSVLGGD